MLAQQRGESWRKPKPRVGGEGGSSLDEVASAGYCRIGRARGAKREGIREEPVLLRLFKLHQLKSGGYGLGGGAYLVLHDGRGNFCPGLRSLGWEVTVKTLRGNRDDAAGAEPGA